MNTCNYTWGSRVGLRSDGAILVFAHTLIPVKPAAAMSGKFAQMASWRDVQAFSQPFVATDSKSTQHQCGSHTRPEAAQDAVFKRCSRAQLRYRTDACLSGDHIWADSASTRLGRPPCSKNTSAIFCSSARLSKVTGRTS